MFKEKKGIYCDDCFEPMNEAICFWCGEIFDISDTEFLYCSDKCSHKRIITEEQKQNLRTIISKKMGYYDKDGNLIDDKDDVRELKKKTR